MKSRHIPVLLLFILIASLASYYFYNRKVVKNKIIYDKIEKVRELASAKQLYREVIYFKNTQDILWIPMGKKEFLISIDYLVIAGIDISKGYKVRHIGTKTVIVLPRAEVLSIDALDSSIKEYFVKERFSSINRDDYFESIQDSKETILNGESINNLLIQSEYNAEQILKSLLYLSGIDVEVEFSNSITEELQ